MNKKIFITAMTVSLLLAGCGKVTPTNTAQQKGKSSSVAATANSVAKKSQDGSTQPSTNATSDTIDYNQYVKKVWVVKNVANYDIYNNCSFCITKIVNGKITGLFTIELPAVPNIYHSGQLTGTINNNTAECQFSDNSGDKGNINLVFKSNNNIEATIQFTNKIQAYKSLCLDGTFEFRPYNLSDMKQFSPIENQSFMVNLNSWGYVKFVSGKGIGGNHIPTLFYLTDKDGNVIYDFSAQLPYSIDVKSVSFQDVNNDGLKDIIIICTDAYNVPAGSGQPIATVYFQKNDGSFASNGALDQELNNSGNNKDIKTVINYLSTHH